MRTDSVELVDTTGSVALGERHNQAVDAGITDGVRSGIETRLATSAEEIKAVERFRYEIYVEELHRYGGRADHDHRRLTDPEDEASWVWYATDGNEILASVRITWGVHGFSARQIDQYRLAGC
jgi:hypothetical protein